MLSPLGEYTVAILGSDLRRRTSKSFAVLIPARPRPQPDFCILSLRLPTQNEKRGWWSQLTRGQGPRPSTAHGLLR